MGIFFKYGFILYNILMMLWMFSATSATSKIATPTGDADIDAAAQSGAALGLGISLMFILFIWAAGAAILGICALLTRPR